MKLKHLYLWIIILVLLVSILILQIFPTNPIILSSYYLVVEISEKFDPYQNIKAVIGGSIEDVNVDTSKIDFSQPGTYPQ